MMQVNSNYPEDTTWNWERKYAGHGWKLVYPSGHYAAM